MTGGVAGVPKREKAISRSFDRQFERLPIHERVLQTAEFIQRPVVVLQVGVKKMN